VRFRILACPVGGWIVGLRQYPGREEGAFDEFRTGLDHFAFAVSSRAELKAGSNGWVSWDPVHTDC
jgi:hypothetical protein